MRSACLFALLLVTAVAPPVHARPRAQDPQEIIPSLLKDARSKSAEVRLQAYDQLIRLGDAGRKALEPVLREAEEKSARDFLGAIEGGAAASYRRWLKGAIQDARDEALKIINDRTAYPDDAHGAVGQPLVDGAVSKLRDLWLRPGRTFLEKYPDLNVQLYYVKEAAEYLDRAGFKPNRFDDLDAARAELDERFDSPGLFYSGTKRRELEEIYEYNDTYLGSATDEERKFARILNDYRVMLGLNALELDERVVQACRKHSQEMQDLNYFAHESPVEANRTPGKRAANEGFNGQVGENCAVSDDAQQAFDGWYRSSGHHRALVATYARQLGIGQSVETDGKPGRYWTMMAASGNSLRGKARRADPRQIFQARKAKLRDGDADTRFRLALFCRKNDLENEAREMLEEVVGIDPRHARAHVLLGHVKSNGRWVTAEAKLAEDIAGKPDADVVAALGARIKGDDPALKVAALRVLGTRARPDESGLAALGLKDPASEVRVAACDALAASKSPSSVGPLKSALSDRSFYVRHAAAEALYRCGDASGVKVLFAGLRDGDLNVRLDAHRRTLSVTGKDFGYAWDLPEKERAAIVDEWETWWDKEASRQKP